VNDLLVVLGKRVHELRATKKWSQEEFAHISGLHRTYIGQIERGEKNISFGNLSKISGVLGVTLSELLSGLEVGDAPDGESKRRLEPRSQRTTDAAHRMLEVQKLVRRLRLQRAAMDRTILVLEELAVSGVRRLKPSRGRPTSRRARASKK
jgi:transcriptional regulator with XRE-family HTH domain